MIDSWDLHLRAERKSAKTIRTYLEAAQWFAAGYLLPSGLTDWDEVKARHVQEWIITLLGRYSDCYANNRVVQPADARPVRPQRAQRTGTPSLRRRDGGVTR